MNNTILEFLEAYKSLDELCKQILSRNSGISGYIEEMNKENQGGIKIACWEKDYKQLKKMRWMRNQLVHEPDSFQNNSVSVEDIEWLKDFRLRIMECTDPFSLLHQAKGIEKQTVPIEKYYENCFKTDKLSCEQKSIIGIILFFGIIFFFGILGMIFLL